ncbi:hypothetical protein F5882DRAFT_14547 [Hyaloscypha sp. PMI_1271]|nr:hypothetical protein F5882DRAFT_14547 [Hyaloscypha sp. PMI_1271]
MSSRRWPSLVAVTNRPFFSISIEGLHLARISYHLPKAGSQVPSAVLDIYHKRSTSLGHFLSTNKLPRRAGPSWPSSNATAEKNFSKPTVDEKGRCKDSQAELNRAQETKNAMNSQIPLDIGSKGVVRGTSKAKKRAKRQARRKDSNINGILGTSTRQSGRQVHDKTSGGLFNMWQPQWLLQRPFPEGGRSERSTAEDSIASESRFRHLRRISPLSRPRGMPVARACDVLGRK